jgi:hypothetical protein
MIIEFLDTQESLVHSTVDRPFLLSPPGSSLKTNRRFLVKHTTLEDALFLSLSPFVFFFVSSAFAARYFLRNLHRGTGD